MPDEVGLVQRLQPHDRGRLDAPDRVGGLGLLTANRGEHRPGDLRASAPHVAQRRDRLAIGEMQVVEHQQQRRVIADDGRQRLKYLELRRRVAAAELRKHRPQRQRAASQLGMGKRRAQRHRERHIRQVRLELAARRTAPLHSGKPRERLVEQTGHFPAPALPSMTSSAKRPSKSSPELPLQARELRRAPEQRYAVSSDRLGPRGRARQQRRRSPAGAGSPPRARATPASARARVPRRHRRSASQRSSASCWRPST